MIAAHAVVRLRERLDMLDNFQATMACSGP
jgi:hypothetical protein